MHWTYESFEKTPDLCQGDILEPTIELKDLFQKVHPHFLDSKYKNFLVLTQSCDLVRRPTFSATHISLSVIRSLSDIVSDSLKDKFGFLAPGIYDAGMKKTVDMLIERIINQNENTLGLFYLHPDGDSGISVPSVAILRVLISVRATEHYEKLMKARVGRLSKEFQPKLGWMVGNLYSRVGVRDWKEEESSATIEQEIINDILRFTRSEPLWINRKIFKKAKEQHAGFDKLQAYEQEKIIKELLPPPPKQEAIDRIINIVKEINVKISEDIIERIKTRLLNDEQFDRSIRRFSKF